MNNVTSLVANAHYMSDHAPVDADFDATPPDGAITVDVENQHLWVRCRGLWVQFV